MATHFSITIRCGHKNIQEVADELSDILSIYWVRDIQHEEVFYEYSDASEWMRLWINDFENDAGIPFESYDFVLLLSALGINGISYEESSFQFAKRIFETLKQSENYDLLLVRDVQEILLSYDKTLKNDGQPAHWRNPPQFGG